ncbi:hypothetical protein TrLO_g10844 [Triparma laevis f. longispina]|uniref:Uncharacterized protein n=1 Tax=Triparma laevis f. longispina TaxID=1714387 RepID=A0A9W7KYM3_9STRA|nr:hypothetical protein TrLO_g10844 [Triparma laevis f. longispina]
MLIVTEGGTSLFFKPSQPCSHLLPVRLLHEKLELGALLDHHLALLGILVAELVKGILIDTNSDEDEVEVEEVNEANEEAQIKIELAKAKALAWKERELMVAMRNPKPPEKEGRAWGKVESLTEEEALQCAVYIRSRNEGVNLTPLLPLIQQLAIVKKFKSVQVLSTTVLKWVRTSALEVTSSLPSSKLRPSRRTFKS